MSRLFAVVFSFLAVTGAIQAQTWVNMAGGNWSAAGNWSPGAPAFTNTTVLLFGSTPNLTIPPASGFLPSSGYTSTADGPTTYVLNQMIFESFAGPTVDAPGVTITTNNAAGTISFQGINPQILQNGTSAVVFADGPATTDITLTASGLTIGGSGLGSLSFLGTIGGNGNLTINQTGGAANAAGGFVFLTPTAANTFNGTVTLSAGNLVVSNGAFGAATNNVNINGGTLRTRYSNATTIPNPLTLNSALVIAGSGSVLTLSGPISGDGGIVMRPSGSAYVSATNAISGNGAISLTPAGRGYGTFVLSDGGTATNASSYNLTNFKLYLDNYTTNATRLNSAAGLTMNGTPIFQMTGNSAAASSESLSAVTISGKGAFNLVPNPARPLSLSFNNLGRVGNSTIFVSTMSSGTLGQSPGTNGNANLFFNNLTSGSNVNGILPYAFAQVDLNPNVRHSLVRYENANGVVPLAPGDYNTTHPYLISSAPTANFRVDMPYGNLAGAKSLNSVSLDTKATAPLPSSVLGTGTWTLSSGVIATTVSGGSGYYGSTFNSLFQPNLGLGGAPGYVHTGHQLALLGNVTGTAGLAKSGDATLSLHGDNSGLSGGLTINSGAVNFFADNNLGAAGAGITLAGGVTNINTPPSQLVFTWDTRYGSGTPNALTVNRPITLGAGGGIIGASQPNTTLTLGGVISGNGGLAIRGSGTTLLINPSNSYFGDTSIIDGTLVASNNALGLGSTVYLYGGTFRPSSAMMTGRRFQLNGGMATIDTGGFNLTINGEISTDREQPNAGIVLYKAGTGTLTLNAANPLNSQFGVGYTGNPVNAGEVVLAGANGSLPLASSFSMFDGKLTLDNSAAVNNNRVGSVPIVMWGSELRMNGNAGANTIEHIGGGTFDNLAVRSQAMGNTITLSQPTSVGNNRNTTLVATELATNASSVTLIRGNNLGNPGAGDHTIMRVVNAAPGYLSGALYADSPTATPQDFVNYDATNGVTRFTAYTPLPASGGNISTVYSHSGSIALTGNVASRALKLNGTIDMGSNLLTAVDGQILSVGANDVFSTTSGTPPTISAFRYTVVNSLTIGSASNPVDISPSSTLVKFGPGVLSVSSAHLLSGNYVYEIGEGVLRLLRADALSNNLIHLKSGATVDLNNLGTPLSPVNAGSFYGGGTINIGSGALQINTNGGGFVGALTGTGTLLIAGSGLFSAGGQSPGYSGDIRLIGGTLGIKADVIPTNLSAPGPLGTGTTPLQLGPAGGSSSVSLIFEGAAATFQRPITVPSFNGTALIYSYGQTTSITNTVTLNRELSLQGGLAMDGVIQDGLSPGLLRLSFGDVSMTRWNTFTGGTYIDSGSPLLLGLGSDSALGTGPLTIVDAANVTLRADSGNRVLANPITVQGNFPNYGYFGFTGRNALEVFSPINLNTTRLNLVSNSTATTTFTGVISNGDVTTALNKSGPGLIVMSAQNTFTGQFVLNSGGLGFGVNSTGAITSGPVGRGMLVVNGGSLRSVGGSRTVANPVTVGGDFAVDGTSALTLSGGMDLGSTVRTVITTNTGLTTFSGALVGSGGGLIKDGPTTLRLTGNNLYPGGTTLTAGTLRVDNGSGSGTGTAGVLVAGGLLRGTGNIAGAITLGAGILGPGSNAGLGTLDTASQPVFTGGVFEANFSTLANFSRLNITAPGDVNLGAGVTALDIGTIYSGAVDGPFSIISTASGTSVLGQFTGLADFAPVFINPTTLKQYLVYYGSWPGQPGNVVIAPVPEPATILGFCAIGGAAAGLFRRWRRKPSAV